jgi:hypothetical protein
VYTDEEKTTQNTQEFSDSLRRHTMKRTGPSTQFSVYVMWTLASSGAG